MLSMFLNGIVPTIIIEQTSDTEAVFSKGRAQIFVEVVGVDTVIDFDTFAVSTETDTHTSIGVTYVIIESENEASSSPDNSTLNEGATNVNAFYYLTETGEVYPAGVGINNTNWIYFMDTTNTEDTHGYYVNSQMTGNLTSGGAGSLIWPTGVSEVGSYTATLPNWGSSDGDDWTRNSTTIYAALVDNGRLYVYSNNNLTNADYIENKGDQVTNAFKGNTFVLTTSFPTAANQIAIFDFGWYIAYDATPGDDDKSFYILIDMPKHAPAGHTWTWMVTMHGEYHSNP